MKEGTQDNRGSLLGREGRDTADNKKRKNIVYWALFFPCIVVASEEDKSFLVVTELDVVPSHKGHARGGVEQSAGAELRIYIYIVCVCVCVTVCPAEMSALSK